jgi:hypothetical protein
VSPHAPEAELTGRRLLLSLALAAAVLLAVALEGLSGQAANSPGEAAYAPYVPLGWPQPVRALWWLAVGGAAASHRLLLDTRPGRRRLLLAAVAALPFVVFAGGVAAEASWTAWH